MPRDSYQGEAGRTRRQAVVVRCACGQAHATEIVRGIDATSDPALARALIEHGPGRVNTWSCPQTGEAAPLDGPVVYHDPVHALFALVLPETWRHRELSERAGLWAELAADPGHPVPDYVRGFEVVFGAAELRAHLQAAADEEVRRALERQPAVAPAEITEVTPRTPASEAMSSADGPTVSGVIGGAGDDEPPVHLRSEDSLILQLGDPERRVEAAVELGQRGHQSALDAVFEAIGGMARTEASEALAGAVGFGAAAIPHLLRGLDSRRAYVRQGCALALAMIADPRAAEALCDRLLVEPTEIWREIARALGEVGAPAVMPLAARVGDAGEDRRERVAWALAHICAHGGRAEVEGLAQGSGAAVAGAARHALELAALAASDRAQVSGPGATREVTVNRAFSRRFFQAMNAPAGVVAEASGPAYRIDEADILAADFEEEALEALDESDLLPT